MSVYNKLTTIENLMAKQSWEKAQNKLDKLLKDVPDKAADKAYIYHSQATLALYQEKYKIAEKYYLLSYQQQALDEKTTATVVYTLANLFMHAGNYRQAVQYLQAYLKFTETPTRQVYLALGSAYYQLKEYQQAVTSLEQAMSLYPPDKSIHLMLFSAYYELKQLGKAAAVLEKVIKNWPDKSQYWLQLASVYLELKKYDRSLEILQLAFTQGLLIKQNELLQFVHTLYEQGLPYKAATILSEALQKTVVEATYKNHSLLAALYADARENERALAAFKTTSMYSSTGREDLYIAQIYYDQEDHNQVIQYAKTALEKGIKQPGSVYMLIAVSHYELDQMDESKTYLVKASKHKEVRKFAEQWLEILVAK